MDPNQRMSSPRTVVDNKRESPKSFEYEGEELDPRVQEELEKLNNCTDEINRLEVQLDDANTVFRSLLSDSTHHLKSLSKKIGSCIEKARPYYEAMEVMMEAQTECQKAAVQFQRAAGIHAAAKETISLAEERFRDNSGEWTFDNAWQEMLNHATIKVMDAEKQRTASEKEHLARSAAFTAAEARCKTLEKKLSRHIEKSKPYFEQKDAFNKALNAEKSRIQGLQAKICQTKSQYAQSLRNLEDISESIHERRKFSAKNVLAETEYASLTYDLSCCHLTAGGGTAEGGGARSSSSAAGSQLTLSEASGDVDSALGSASIEGEMCSIGGGDLNVIQGVGVDEKSTVSRSVSLPNQLSNLTDQTERSQLEQEQHISLVADGAMASATLVSTAHIMLHEQLDEESRTGQSQHSTQMVILESKPGGSSSSSTSNSLLDNKQLSKECDNSATSGGEQGTKEPTRSTGVESLTDLTPIKL
eukprot:TRINITY_DN9539_c0_g1_i5.p1 TRINITY_DN9539_c0_g1~~TRINITY_DN9539_c0_g1_i5.p1  ORF type:complete len:474 (-),score=112.98 TRINITY_DN9539_c0_g1_i5:526-1947(-)